jgi:3-deoxy-D-manno-octulosonic-acid transferase
MHLYKYAQFAYIGGGFGVGIHNILEAATYGKPIFFGPNYHKFNEAKELIAIGGAFTISDAEDLLQLISKMANNPSFYQKVCMHSSAYVKDRIGATEVIWKTL